MALVVLVGSILTLVARQTQALRKLKSAERAREMASQLAKLDGAGSGTRLLAVLQALYSDNPLMLGKLGRGDCAPAASYRPRRHRAAQSRRLRARWIARRTSGSSARQSAPSSACPPVRTRRSTPLW